MKKILAVVLCICIALTLSITAMAQESPQNKVIVRQGIGTKADGSSVSVDTFVEIAEDGTITVVADEEKYGTFDSWSIYVVSDAAEKATDAKEGTDYTIVKGTLKTKTLTVRPINRIAICGNYKGTITDPLSASSVPGTKPDKSVKTSDLSVMYIAIVMLAAGALVFGAKRQLSK